MEIKKKNIIINIISIIITLAILLAVFWKEILQVPLIVSSIHTDVRLKNGLKIGQVIPESIEIRKVFLAEKNPVVKLGLVIK